MTLLEVVIAAAIGSSLLLAGAAAMRTSTDGSSALMCRSALETKCADAADAVVLDLQVAGLHGEDENGNGVTDPDEDQNRNGRLDADWSLPDGTTASGIRFNTVRRGWDWSGPIDYAV